MSYTHLLVKKQGHICRVILNRPDKLNSLSDALLDELSHVFDHIESDVRGILIEGAGGRALAAGADISAFTAMNTHEKGYAFAKKGQDIFAKIEQSARPVIALVQGYAFGGGSELAMAAHLRIATPDAKFAQPEIKLGTIPGYGGTVRLKRIAGHAKALEWILTGRTIHADEALKAGLVNAIVEPENILDKGLEWLNKIAQMSPKTISAVLECFQPHHDFEKEAQLFGKCCATQDFQEGVHAFLNKRTPQFKGN